jgi:hypothetical protein
MPLPGLGSAGRTSEEGGEVEERGRVGAREREQRSERCGALVRRAAARVRGQRRQRLLPRGIVREGVEGDAVEHHAARGGAVLRARRAQQRTRNHQQRRQQLA